MTTNIGRMLLALRCEWEYLFSCSGSSTDSTSTSSHFVGVLACRSHGIVREVMRGRARLDLEQNQQRTDNCSTVPAMMD
jgi:hypothetical protein